MPYELEQSEKSRRTPSQDYLTWESAAFLPGVDCPRCGGWATTGLSYPLVDDRTIELMQLPSESCISIEQWRVLRDRVSSLLGAAVLVLPGTSIGRSTVAIVGTPPKFGWIAPWFPVMARSVMDDLRSRGIVVTGAVVRTATPGDGDDPFVEVFAPPVFNAETTDPASPGCDLCGRSTVRIKEPIVAVAKHFDDAVPIQRISEHPTRFVVSDALAEYLSVRFPDQCTLTKIR